MGAPYRLSHLVSYPAASYPAGRGRPEVRERRICDQDDGLGTVTSAYSAPFRETTG
jgi:hypothetical protein